MMMMNRKRRDQEQLSAYLDGQLSQTEARQLEEQLANEPRLQAELEGLRRTKAILRAAPRAKAPRSFALTPEMAGRRSGLAGWARGMQWASTMATLLLVAVFAGEMLFSGSQNMAMEQSAPQPEAAFLLEATATQEVGAMDTGLAPTDTFGSKSDEPPLPGDSPEEDAGEAGDEEMADEDMADEDMDAEVADDAAAEDDSASPAAGNTASGAGGSDDIDEQDAAVEAATEEVDETATEAAAQTVTNEGESRGVVEAEQPTTAEPTMAPTNYYRVAQLALLGLAVVTGGLAVYLRRR